MIVNNPSGTQVDVQCEEVNGELNITLVNSWETVSWQISWVEWEEIVRQVVRIQTQPKSDAPSSDVWHCKCKPSPTIAIYKGLTCPNCLRSEPT